MTTTFRMRHPLFVVLPALALALPLIANAGDHHLRFPLADAMSTPQAKAKTDPGIQLFWGTQKTETAVAPAAAPASASSPATPAANVLLHGAMTVGRVKNYQLEDKDACQQAFALAVANLQALAAKNGGNAVEGVVSYFDVDVEDGNTQYVCGAGNYHTAVYLRGDVIKLP